MQPYIKDSCIKPLEYIHECAKKIMNKYLKKVYDKPDKELTINNIFREMYGLGFIKNFDNWILYRAKRNVTSHEYNLNETYSIINIIPDFIDDVRYLIEKLEGK